MKKYRIAPKAVKPMSTIKFRTKASAGGNNADSSDFFDRTADRLRKDLSGNADVIMRELFIGGNENIDALLVYLMGNIDKKLLSDSVIKPLMTCGGLGDIEARGERLKEHITKKCLQTGSVKYSKDYNTALQDMFSAEGILLVRGIEGFIIFTVAGGQKRQISEPETEKRIRGTKEGFIEDIWVNIGMIREFIKDPMLKIEMLKIGQRSQTDVAIIYINGLADSKIVDEVKKRINKINIDAILSSGYVEQYIEDNPWSVFPQLLGTEKPDKAVANLLEGKLLIITDRSPFVFTAPAVFIEFFQATEDYYEKFHAGIFSRIIRLIAFLIAVLGTSIYIALTSFHPELIPSELLISFARLRKKVPFPPVIETLLMEFTVEILREAGIRLPTSVAGTLGIVGGIILGDAAIRSNLVSPAMIVVIAITTVCNFVMPNYSMTLSMRLLKLFLILLSAVFGAYGIALGLLVIVTHLARLESFSVPYLSPYAPFRFSDMKDALLRLPLWMHVKRPVSIPHMDDKRAVNNREKSGTGEN
ncbi:MAG TPA: spore germination protein [Bacillota bacterium]|nr:spore germination protein [Bacillota bacterium]HNT04405.1 spore germination protein [Bacillota bacterium]HPA54893.1 spore germination protein [Bacillota bacterium]HPX68566.1 spore germination protein [Bacillota bacterium]HQA65813.1 spore germination protein [Bacillota bacterium]